MRSSYTGSVACAESFPIGYLRTSQGKPRCQESTSATAYIKPAAVRAGVGKIGWHTFRHSGSSLLPRVRVRLHGRRYEIVHDVKLVADTDLIRGGHAWPPAEGRRLFSAKCVTQR